jgi:hypothetical protein
VCVFSVNACLCLCACVCVCVFVSELIKAAYWIVHSSSKIPETNSHLNIWTSIRIFDDVHVATYLFINWIVVPLECTNSGRLII